MDEFPNGTNAIVAVLAYTGAGGLGAAVLQARARQGRLASAGIQTSIPRGPTYQPRSNPLIPVSSHAPCPLATTRRLLKV